VNPGDSEEQRRRAYILRRFRQPGKDPLTLAIEVCRERKVPVVFSFRMAEGGSYHASLERPAFSRQHREWTIGEPLPGGSTTVPGLGEMLGGQGGWGMDRAIPEVYAHQMAIFKEALENFDVDGIEFDFKRYYPMISNPRANHPVHTRLVREMRALLDDLAKKKGRGRMLLGARVSYSIDGPLDPRLGIPGVDFNCKDLGLDVETWIREGCVDYVCPSYFHGRDLPGHPDTREFAELAKGTRVGIYPTTFARPRWPEKERHPDSEASWRRFRDEICADALHMYADGADGISTYNMNPGDYANPLLYPPPRNRTPGESFRRGSPAYNRIVAAVMARLGSPQELRRLLEADLDFMRE